MLRSYIAEADGGRRPLGILTLEDKIVQGAVAEVLSAVYEADFLDCSFGFRPGRSPHQALRTVHDAIMGERVGWIVEGDIRNFFGELDQAWLVRMLAHRIADPRILRLIRLWLRAGVMENGVYAETVEGTPQGSGISPLLANIYLHYVLDLWVQQWQGRHATGRMRLVRFADDYLLTFERRADAEAMLAALPDRPARFGLVLHEDKTRLIEFGRFAEANRRRRGAGRPETFDFLGFTHYCGRTRAGRFMVQRKTQRKRMIRKLTELRREMKRRMHHRLADQHQWLSAVLRGHYAYYGITINSRCIPTTFQFQLHTRWRWMLRRRGQRPKLPWRRFNVVQSDPAGLSLASAPESSQTFLIGGQRWQCGRRSANALAAKIDRCTVRCEGREHHRNGSLIAVCYAAGGADLNAWLVRDRWALACRP